MDTLLNVVLPLSVVSAVIAVLVILHRDQSKTAPAWIHRTAFRIRFALKWLLYAGLLIYFLVVVLPLTVQDGSTWLAPESTFGYAAKYNLPNDKVYIEPKPHDCEWDKAAIGNKYCHFEKTVLTEKNSQGKVTAVYVNWERKED
jgi:hypothetical protein